MKNHCPWTGRCGQEIKSTEFAFSLISSVFLLVEVLPCHRFHSLIFIDKIEGTLASLLCFSKEVLLDCDLKHVIWYLVAECEAVGMSQHLQGHGVTLHMSNRTYKNMLDGLYNTYGLFYLV